MRGAFRARAAAGSRPTRRPSWPSGWRKDGHMTSEQETVDGREPEPPVERGQADAPFDGPVEFTRVLYQALLHAERVAARRMCWCDDDFAAWPLGEVDWLAMMTRWARLGGRE